ncbi:MAG: hypothetical protein H8D86_01010, partial [Planctomycetes bacterium]|nr:hypothetical protein [Planctomycetota bacterium]
MNELPSPANLVGEPPLVDLQRCPRLDPENRAGVVLNAEVGPAAGHARA